ncbi:hypothetical protein EIK77_001527 [Talaromyces pinophilus]|jgi:25S rRNA (cytosine2278-C5)-methyltransferase|nr:hypothetical protein EIK77_001527 [Talaromyces pinophilus]
MFSAAQSFLIIDWALLSDVIGNLRDNNTKMSLYYDTSTILTSSSNNQGGSFKSRIYNSKSLKASPVQIYALVTEASKWDILLKEVIENAGILSSESKV